MHDISIPVETFDNVLRIASPETATPPSPRVRIEEVARLAGVSPITVSRTLRKPDVVSEKTRARVTDAVRKTGFSLNPHASALRSGRTNIVAAFISSTASPQFLVAADAFSTVVEAEGYEVVLARTSYSYDREIQLTRTLYQMRPVGAFITGVMELELNRSMFRQLDIPVVESWANTDTPIDMLVAVSNTDGARAAARLLAERGYKRPAFIGRSSGRGLIRRDAFRQECITRGLEYVDAIACPNVRSTDDGRAALSELLARHKNVDAVFCANDLLACGALVEARARGLSIPDSLAIVGFGDNDLMREIAPGVTTITPDPRQLGKSAGEMLAARLKGKEMPVSRIALPLEIRMRGSC